MVPTPSADASLLSPADSFGERLSAAVRRCRNPVCVGLDPRFESLPAPLRAGRDAASTVDRAAAFAEFSCRVIDAVRDLVPIVKPQAAFFEALGPAGMQALADVLAHARQAGLETILDGKRNDIGSTAEAYADAWIGRRGSAWGSDSLTVSPYLGDDTLLPFVRAAEARGGGIFVLVKTSNPGSAALQDRTTTVDGRVVLIRDLVAQWVEGHAARTARPSGYGDVGAVVGATYPRELGELRRAMPHAWLLVPGYGAQGGGADDVAAGFDDRGLGAIVNNSRGILFAHAAPEYRERVTEAGWIEAVRMATEAMIAALRERTTVGQL